METLTSLYFRKNDPCLLKYFLTLYHVIYMCNIIGHAMCYICDLIAWPVEFIGNHRGQVLSIYALQ